MKLRTSGFGVPPSGGLSSLKEEPPEGGTPNAIHPIRCQPTNPCLGHKFDVICRPSPGRAQGYRVYPPGARNYERHTASGGTPMCFSTLRATTLASSIVTGLLGALAGPAMAQQNPPIFSWDATIGWIGMGD